ncbi:membrane protein insertase YidC [Corynebacterium uterequi]|uniref:Membrane protein insertase YidC n=1 Tax=Corynebacterium uterequi TaxID=1072256 RepID=A0A0G3HJT8_9CORY|nr:membrane protein insertase YidC [Corynebacterium uterequi]AKK12193.1 preprotein translocase subunit [Corynebacterium uterequi]
MLNFIYYPISAVMWFWREALTFLGMNANAGVTWLLAIVLLTATIKALLVYPMVQSLRSSRKMQELTPKIQAVRERYKNDKTKLAEETQKVYKDAGFNPLSSCIPMFVQIPVFIGIFHVLRSFNRTGTAAGGLGLTVEENRAIGNYIFSAEDVRSFLDAEIFGVPLSVAIGTPTEQFAAYGTDFTRLDVAYVAVPFIVLIVLFTHFNARYTLNRQHTRQASGKAPQPTGDNAEMMQMQQQMMGKMMLWVFPAMTIMTGYLWAIGLLAYMLTNTVWTFVQTRLVYKKMDKEEEEEIARREKVKAELAPVVNARTVDKRSKKQRKAEQEAQQLAEQQAKERALKQRQAAQRARSQSKKKKKN